MSTTAQVVAIIASLLSLFLVVRNFQGHGLSTNATIKMAAAWLVIIVAGVLIVKSFTG